MCLPRVWRVWAPVRGESDQSLKNWYSDKLLCKTLGVSAGTGLSGVRILEMGERASLITYLSCEAASANCLIRPKTHREAASDLCQTCREAVSDLCQTCREAVSDLCQTCREAASDLCQTCREAVSDLCQTCREAVSDLCQTCREAASDLRHAERQRQT